MTNTIESMRVADLILLGAEATKTVRSAHPEADRSALIDLAVDHVRKHFDDPNLVMKPDWTVKTGPNRHIWFVQITHNTLCFELKIPLSGL